MADGIGSLILEGVCPKRRGRRELLPGVNLPVIHDARDESEQRNHMKNSDVIEVLE
jgi:hypothetical protein